MSGLGDKMKNTKIPCCDFFLSGGDILCDDKSDINKRAVDGLCPSGATPCMARLLRPLSSKCKDYDADYAAEYPWYFEGFNFDEDCNDETEICIEKNSTSKCDLHPQCVDGEDEKDCEKEYIRKGFFLETETFMCDYPNHTFVNIDNSTWTLKILRAIRCDGDSTCPNGEDEKNCKILAETIRYIIRK